MATLQRRTIKEFVLERVLAPLNSPSDEDKALKELEALLTSA